MEHLTSGEVAAFRNGTLDRARIEAVGAHVRECSECARLVWEDDGVRESIESMWMPEERPARFGWLAVAAIVLLAAAGMAWWWFSRNAGNEVPGDIRPAPQVATKRMIRDGAATIVLADGAVQSVATPRAEWNELASVALRTGSPPHADLAGLTGSGEILRGDDATAPRLTLEPVGVVVESATPRFQWTPVRGARYRVIVALDGNVVAKSDLLRDATWTPDAPLARGATYAWQLTVTSKDREWTLPPPDSPPARFRVLSATEQQDLDAARASGSRLVTGLLAARFGLIDVAASELNAFSTQHPEISVAARLARSYDRPAPTTTNADQ